MAERLVQTRAHVPFVDLTAVHEELTPRLLEDIAALIESGQFINGPAVADGTLIVTKTARLRESSILRPEPFKRSTASVR